MIIDYDEFEYQTLKGLEKQLAFSSKKLVEATFRTSDDQMKAMRLVRKLQGLVEEAV